jgi:membrane protease YdiL (CAAX protease family)
MAAPAPERERASIAGVLLRAGLFLLVIRILGGLFGWALNQAFGLFPAATLSILAASLLASAFVLRVFERAHLADIGLGWSQASRRHFLCGLAGGAGAALLVTLLALLARLASVERSSDPAAQFGFGKLLFVSVLLLFGVVGEEVMFRGYAFQLVLSVFRPWATILPFAVLFAAAHVGNLNTSALSLVNTGLWGVVFGYAFCRSGDLWLPIGLHFGWNWVLPLFGVPLSGFTMGLTGYELRWQAGALWSGAGYGLEASLLTTAAVLALGWWLWRLRLQPQSSLLFRPPAGEA